jgi:hypothetical protein
MKKVIVEIDGRETEYNSLSECAKALGVPVATVYNCASYGYECKGHVVRYADGTRRVRHRGKTTTTNTSQVTAEDVVKMITKWYIKEWKEYISSDALVSMYQYIKDNWHKS